VPANLRVLQVEGAPENVGSGKSGCGGRLRRGYLGHFRIAQKLWIEGAQRRSELQFGARRLVARFFHCEAGEEQQATFTYRTHAAGYLEARLNSRDGSRKIDRAVVELPSREAPASGGLIRTNRRC